ncbi:MAG: radical SAM protein [Pseudomonadota bacterium]
MPHRYQIEDLSYQVSDFCPGPCRYCSMWRLPKRQNEELSSDELDSIFSSKYLDLKKVHITGGEPHLSETYLKAIDSIAKFHPDTVIDSPITGWFPERHEEVAKYVLKKMNLIRLDISLDGDEETNAKIRLHKNGFQKSIETIERLRKIKGVVLRFQFTIYKQNLHLIEWMYHFAKEMGVGLYIGYGRYNPERYKNEKDNLTKKELNQEDFFLTPEDREEIDRQLIKIGYPESRYASKYTFQKAISNGENIDVNCYMGARSIDIDPYGNIYPCLLWLPYLKFGNLKEAGSFDQVIENNAHILDKIEHKVCQKDCLYTCANKCEIVKPNIKSVGMMKYSGGKYGYIFSENDVIPIRPWWYDEYKEKGVI